MRKYGVTGEWTARSLALYTQAALQGSFILAKAKGGPAVAAECVDHLRNYVKMLFQQTVRMFVHRRVPDRLETVASSFETPRKRGSSG